MLRGVKTKKLSVQNVSVHHLLWKDWQA